MVGDGRVPEPLPPPPVVDVLLAKRFELELEAAGAHEAAAIGEGVDPKVAAGARSPSPRRTNGDDERPEVEVA